MKIAASIALILFAVFGSQTHSNNQIDYAQKVAGYYVVSKLQQNATVVNFPPGKFYSTITIEYKTTNQVNLKFQTNAPGQPAINEYVKGLTVSKYIETGYSLNINGKNIATVVGRTLIVEIEDGARLSTWVAQRAL